MKDFELLINTQVIENFIEHSSGLDSQTVSYELPDFLLIDKTKSDRCILDIFEEDSEQLQGILSIDMDKYLGKKVRIIIQAIGKAGK